MENMAKNVCFTMSIISNFPTDLNDLKNLSSVCLFDSAHLLNIFSEQRDDSVLKKLR